MKKFISMVLSLAMVAALAVPAFADSDGNNLELCKSSDNSISYSTETNTVYVDVDKVYEDENYIYFYKDLGDGYLNLQSNSEITTNSITTTDVAIYASYYKALGIFTPIMVLSADGYKVKKLFCSVVKIAGGWGYYMKNDQTSEPAIPGNMIQLAVAFSGLDNTISSTTETATFQGPYGYFICTDGTYGTYPTIRATFSIS